MAILDYLVVGDYWDDNVLRAHTISGKLDYPLYRGLYLPTDLLRPGSIIEQWGGSTHWTASLDVARRFTKVCSNEEYVEEYGAEHGTDGSFEEGVKLFSKVILCLHDAVDVLPSGRLLAAVQDDPEFLDAIEAEETLGNESLKDIIAEDEHSLFDYDFQVIEAKKIGDTAFAIVRQIKEEEKC